MPTSKKIAAKTPKKPATVTPKSASSTLEGKKAPAFDLFDADGKSVALKDLIGANNLVLFFYPKDMTPGCTIEACSFRDNIAPIKKARRESRRRQRRLDRFARQVYREARPQLSAARRSRQQGLQAVRRV
jgi:hypothetical protein